MDYPIESGNDRKYLYLCLCPVIPEPDPGMPSPLSPSKGHAFCYPGPVISWKEKSFSAGYPPQAP